MDWNNKKDVLDVVKINGCSLQYASDELKDDYEIVLEACRREGYNLKYASERLRTNENIVLFASRNDGWALQYASEILKDNKSFILKSSKQDGFYTLQYASDRLKKDKEVILEACQNNKSAFILVPIDIKESDFGRVLKYKLESSNFNKDDFIERNPKFFEDALVKINDYSISFGDALTYVSDEDLRDTKIIEALINRFSKYECSKYFDLNSLKDNPNLLFKHISSFDFEEESYSNNCNFEK